MLTRSHHYLLLLCELRQVRIVIFLPSHNISHFWGAGLRNAEGGAEKNSAVQTLSMWSVVRIHFLNCTEPFKDDCAKRKNLCILSWIMCWFRAWLSDPQCWGWEWMAHGKFFLKHYNRVFYQNVDTSNYQWQVKGRLTETSGLEANYFAQALGLKSLTWWYLTNHWLVVQKRNLHPLWEISAVIKKTKLISNGK